MDNGQWSTKTLGTLTTHCPLTIDHQLVRSGREPLFRSGLSEKLLGQFADSVGDADAGEVAELAAEAIERHDGLRHRAVPARAADVAEVRFHELARVPGIAQVPDADNELPAHDAGDDRPLDVLDLE